MRIAKLIQQGETVVNMFAGVGCYSICIAKHSKADKIYSIDINPNAVRIMKENTNLNKVWNRLISIKGDAAKVIENELAGKADRVLMPLPEKAYDYLDSAVKALKPSGGWIHFYDMTYARKRQDAVSFIVKKVSEKLANSKISFKIVHSRIVRDVGPHWYQVALDMQARS